MSLSNRWWLFLSFQAVPLLIVFMGVIGLIGDYMYSFHFYGHLELPSMTEFERNPVYCLNRFWEVVEMAVFFFALSVPGQVIVIRMYDWDQREKRRNKKRARV